MSDVDKNLNDALNVYEGEVLSTNSEPKEIKRIEETKDASKDYRTVRKNLKDIINVGSGAIDGILEVASETESPRAYEVAAQMIKTVSEANKDLIELHKKMKDINKQPEDSAKSVTNNSIFVGSTKELQDLVREQRKIIDCEVVEDAEE